MKVLHDWDRLEVEGRRAISRGLSLLIYGLARKFRVLNKFHFIHENTLKIEGEKLAYMETLIKLNKLCGVDQIFGIRGKVKKIYEAEIDALALKYGVDVRDHYHLGKQDDPLRIRFWYPYLEDQTRASWGFDTDFETGTHARLGPNERPIFHVDRPFHLALYIKYIFEILNKEP